MAQTSVIEGTGEELERYLKQRPNERFRLIPLRTDEGQFHETATTEEWIQAFDEWAKSHDPHTPPLSDEAISRDSIYEGRG